MSLLSLYVERIENEDEPSSRRSTDTRRAHRCPGIVWVGRLAISSNLGNNLLSPTFTRNKAKKKKKKVDDRGWVETR